MNALKRLPVILRIRVLVELIAGLNLKRNDTTSNQQMLTVLLRCVCSQLTLTSSYRRSRIQNAIDKLNSQLQSYELELESLKQDEHNPTVINGVSELRESLRKQIESHMDHLRGTKEQKLAKLALTLEQDQTKEAKQTH